MQPIEPQSFPRISGLVLFLLLIAIADAVARFFFLAGVSSTYDQLRQVLPAAEVPQAVLAIRRKDMVRHREWMIRMFSLGLSAGTIRIVGVTLLVVAPASAVELRVALTLWLGFALSLAGGEFYLR